MDLNNIGSVYGGSGNRQKAFDYHKRSLTMAREHRQPLVEAMSLNNLGGILKDSIGHEAEGIRYVEQANKLFKQLNRPVFLADGLETIGHVYLDKKQYAKALPYIQEALDTYHTYNWPQGLDEGHNFDKSLYRIHKGLNHPSTALFHLEQYTALLDSTLRSEIKSGRDVVEAQLDKEKQQRQIAQLKLRALEQQQTVQNRTRQGLLGGLGLMSLFAVGISWYNRKLKSQNNALQEKNDIIKEVTLKVQTTEMAALRSQMNPHFIFNCLNSIQYFTAQNKADKASDYLTKFSRLIRLVLENSKSERVTLANELETLRLYIEMEAMRFGPKMNYRIEVDEGLDADFVQIPPLLLQPFVENAIWHGLMHKEEGGNVVIKVQQPQDDRLHIEITDDGIGRQQAAEYKSKSATKNKSFGMKLTAERIELINHLYNTQTQVSIIDLTDADNRPTGTRVLVDIPV
jgi:tetratricopeptide (TPR) repeat protein